MCSRLFVIKISSIARELGKIYKYSQDHLHFYWPFHYKHLKTFPRFHRVVIHFPIQMG